MIYIFLDRQAYTWSLQVVANSFSSLSLLSIYNWVPLLWSLTVFTFHLFLLPLHCPSSFLLTLNMSFQSNDPIQFSPHWSCIWPLQFQGRKTIIPSELNMKRQIFLWFNCILKQDSVVMFIKAFSFFLKTIFCHPQYVPGPQKEVEEKTLSRYNSIKI